MTMPQLRTLGRNGPQVSLVGLGCNNFGGRLGLEETRAVVHKALDLGIHFFDTADVYGNRGGSETLLGKVLGQQRREIFLATKFGLPMDDSGHLKGASRQYVLSAIDASLDRLNTDWIDLYQLHRPDPFTPLEETLLALHELVSAGKVRYIGVSNLPAWQVVQALWIAQRHKITAIVTTQNEYNLLARDIERELIPAINEFGLGLLPYFPLASGILTGKYQRNAEPPAGSRLACSPGIGARYLNARNWKVLDDLHQFARQRNRSLLELSYAWLAAQPAVSCIIAGATRPEQLEQNLRAAEWELSADEQIIVSTILEQEFAAA
jgi:aryl-alcohol dehydrogenase-like predicted oxidoreductase